LKSRLNTRGSDKGSTQGDVIQGKKDCGGGLGKSEDRGGKPLKSFTSFGAQAGRAAACQVASEKEKIKK